MNRILISIAIVAALGIGIFLGSTLFSGSDDPIATSTEKQQYTCGMHPEIISDEPGYCPICEMKLTPIRKESTSTQSGDKGKIAYWVAPMDPTYIRNEPGKSPMGMDLVPVYENDISGSVIKIDPVTSQNMGLKMARATKEKLTRTIDAVAHITYNEENVYGINSKVQGWIEKLYVDFDGKDVRKGDPLLEIYSPELVAAQKEYLSALNNYSSLKNAYLESARKGAKDLLDAARDRLLLWDVSQNQIDELENSGKVKKNLVLYSPADGVVTSKMVVDGDKVMPGMKMMQIADLSSVWAKAHIYEYELPYVSVGQNVEISLPYLPGKIYKGKIAFIYPYLDGKSRDVEIRVNIPNRDGELKPSMYANVKLESTLPGERIVIPNQSVIRSGPRSLVFLSLGDGKFLPREIQLGAYGQDDMIEVVSGVNPGDMVVTSAQFMLDSESRLREATSKIRAQMASVKVTSETPGEQEDNSGSDMQGMKMDKSEKMADPPAKKEDSKPAEKLSGIYTCPMESDSDVVQMGPGECPKCGMDLVPIENTNRHTVYECPMSQDSVVSAMPGKCPKCGMKLVEKTIGMSEDHHNHPEADMKKMKMEKSGESKLSGVYTCPMDSHADVIHLGPGKCDKCGMNLVPVEQTKGRTFYECPMPQDSVVSSTPGKCPKCGMKLVEKKIEGKAK